MELFSRTKNCLLALLNVTWLLVSITMTFSKTYAAQPAPKTIPSSISTTQQNRVVAQEEKTPSTRSSLADQPLNHLNLIFSKLSLQDNHNVQRTCKRFFKIAPNNLPHISFAPYRRKLSKQAMIRIVRAYPSVTSLNFAKCSQIDDEALQAITDAALSLTNLVLTGCPLTDAGIVALASGKKAILLTNLDISYCIELTDTSLLALAMACSELVYLNLTFCEKITDGGLLPLIAACTKLQELNIANCRAITDSVLTTLATSCPGLKAIDLRWCNKLTYKGIQALANACKKLTFIDIASCQRITLEEVQKLQKEFPHITIHHKTLRRY